MFSTSLGTKWFCYDGISGQPYCMRNKSRSQRSRTSHVSHCETWKLCNLILCTCFTTKKGHIQQDIIMFIHFPRWRLFKDAGYQMYQRISNGLSSCCMASSVESSAMFHLSRCSDVSKWLNFRQNPGTHSPKTANGGCIPTPLKNYDFVNWDDLKFPIFLGKSNMATKPPTRKYRFCMNVKPALAGLTITHP